MTERKEGAGAPYDSFYDTRRHIARVRELLTAVTLAIVQRGIGHDASKLEPPEKAAFDEYTPKLAGVEYGSDEYQGFLDGMQEALDHHYRENRHHPEHFEAGVASMNLVDLLEMLADWKAASERHADGGDLGRSIRINAERFGMSGWLKDCLLHTAEDLGWWDGTEEGGGDADRS
jgi:hypothetical protein